jgi:hypothetical protein
MAPDVPDLMVRYCDGDDAAFRALYAALAPRLHAISARGTEWPGFEALIQKFRSTHAEREGGEIDVLLVEDVSRSQSVGRDATPPAAGLLWRAAHQPR